MSPRDRKQFAVGIQGPCTTNCQRRLCSPSTASNRVHSQPHPAMRSFTTFLISAALDTFRPQLQHHHGVAVRWGYCSLDMKHGALLAGHSRGPPHRVASDALRQLCHDIDRNSMLGLSPIPQALRGHSAIAFTWPHDLVTRTKSRYP